MPCNNSPTEIGTEEWKNLLVSCAGQSGIAVQSDHTEKFAIYALELLRWNQKINLTAIIDPTEIAVKHFADCLMPAKLIPDGSILLDIGSGGGFPGIVLKIFKPSLKITLIEASRKKVSFQKHIIRLLQLKEIRAHHIRSEDAAKNFDFTANFDVVICRAFSALDSFVPTALPFLSQSGRIVAMMGKFSEKEFAILKDTEARYRLRSSIEQYRLPMIDAERTLVSLTTDQAMTSSNFCSVTDVPH